MAVLLHPIEPMIKMKLLLTVLITLIISLARVFLKSLTASQKTDIIITPDAILNSLQWTIQTKVNINVSQYN